MPSRIAVKIIWEPLPSLLREIKPEEHSSPTATMASQEEAGEPKGPPFGEGGLAGFSSPCAHEEAKKQKHLSSEESSDSVGEGPILESPRV